MDRRFHPLGVALACLATTAGAASGDADHQGEDAPPIVVTVDRPDAGVRAISSATKTPTDIRNVPQAITIVSGRQIADQQLRSVGDLLLFVPGASYGSGEGNRDQIVLRGNSSTADFFVDGVRDDVQYFRDFYNIDRVEVLKGPNAMIFGRGGGGGIVNRVLKRPAFRPLRSLTASADNWGALRFSADVDQTLSSTVGVRINGLYEDSDGFRRHTELKRYGINPVVALIPGPDTRIDVSFEHFRDRRTADRGVPADGDEPVRGHDRDFFGDPDRSFARSSADVATFALEHRLSSSVTLKNRMMFGNYRKFYQNVFASSFTPTSGLVGLAGYNNLNDRRSVFSQTDILWRNRLAGIEQTLLVGFELGRERSRNRRATARFLSGGSVPIWDPTQHADVLFAPLPTDADNRVHASVAALYAQDQLRPAEWIEILTGIRVDSFRVSIRDLRSGGQFGRTDHLFSPRLGLVIKPASRLSFYASLSRSYLPQSGDQFSSLTSVTEGLKPERFDNEEIGAKVQLPGGLLATAAIYRLYRSNTRAADPLNPALTVLTGRQKSRGLELGLEGSVTSRLLIYAGYTLQKATITRTTSAAPAGREVPLVPRHSLSLWTRYDFNHRVGAGLGLIARSRSYATISNQVKLPAYARLDAAFYYKLPGGMEARLNAENLLGAHYFPTANADNNITPGAPRTLKASLGYRF